MHYLKNSHLVKPNRWGSNLDVRNAVRHYYENTLGVAAPVLYMPFWEGSGGLFTNYGTWAGNPTGNINKWDTGPNGTAINFSESNTQGIVQSNLISGNFSVFAIASRDHDTPTTGVGKVQNIVTNRYPTAIANFFEMNVGNGFGLAADKNKPRLGGTAGTTYTGWLNGTRQSSADPFDTALVNGRVYSIAGTFYNAVTQAGGYLAIGGDASVDNFCMFGRIFLLYILTDTFDDTSVYSSHTQPYAAIQPRSVPVYFFPASGVGDTSISVVSSANLAESISAQLDDLQSITYDEISTAESLQFSFDSFITVADNSTIADVVIAESILYVSAYDTAEITESIVSSVGSLTVVIYDSVTSTEEVSVVVATVSELQLTVLDAVTVVDSLGITLDDTLVSVSDAVTVTENAVTVQELIHISTFDGTEISEDITAIVTSVEDATIAVVSSVGIDEVVVVSLSDNEISAVEVVSVLESISTACSVSVFTFDSVETSDVVNSSLSDLAAVVQESISVVSAPVTELFQGTLEITTVDITTVAELPSVFVYSTADILIDVYSTFVVTEAVVQSVSGYVAYGVLAFLPEVYDLTFSCEPIDLTITAEAV